MMQRWCEIDAQTTHCCGGHERYQVASLRDAVDQYCAARRKSGLGASEMPRVTIVDQDGEDLYTVRYNGSIWTVDANANFVEVTFN
jgi:hypothetical protein